MKRILASAALVIGVAGCSVSTQQEVEMGTSYAQQVNQELPIVADPEINRYINVLGDSIARLTGRGDLDWHFYVVDSKEVNAFAIPGGFIYVNRGLIERSQNLSQLAGVLGHEIGHVVKRHSIEQMRQQQKANIGVTLACVLTKVCNNEASQQLINVAGTAVFAKFSRSDEMEADEEGIKNVVRAGINPNGIPEMFMILLEERKTRPASVDAWFATHPMEEDRIAQTSAIIEKTVPQAVLNTLIKDSPNFHSFKQRILSMPPSPATRAGN